MALIIFCVLSAGVQAGFWANRGGAFHAVLAVVWVLLAFGFTLLPKGRVRGREKHVGAVAHTRPMVSAEQRARDLLERCGVEDAQSFTAGDVVELANLLVEVDRLRAATRG